MKPIWLWSLSLFAFYASHGIAADAATPAVSAEAAPVDPGSANEAAPSSDIAESAVSTPSPLSSGDVPETVAVIPVDIAKEPAEADVAVSREPQSRFVEEIVVTAQKRKENVMDVPISITAFSADRLAAQGIETTNDLQLVTPGLTYTGIAGFSLVYLRGVGTSAYISSFDPSVATYVDGIYVPSQHGALTDLGGVERVEILKGPQGTLFGRNSTGGAINVTTRTPLFEEEAAIDVEMGNFGSRKAKAYLGIPLTQSIALGVSAVYSSRESYYDLVDDPGDFHPPQQFSLINDETKGARAKLLWQLSDDFRVDLSGYSLRQRGSSGMLGPIKEPSLAGTFLGVNSVGDYKTNVDTKPIAEVTNEAIYGSATWERPRFDSKILYGTQKIISNNIQYDFDGSQADIAAFTTRNAPNELQTAELQLVSNKTSWGADWLTWAGGFFYLHQEAGYDPLDIQVVPRSVNLTPDGPVLGALPDEVAQLLNLTGTPLEGPGLRVLINGMLETNSYSGYLQTTVDFTDWLGLTLGGRYTREDRFLFKQEVGVPGAEGVLRYHQPKVEQSNLSPKASLNLRFASDTLLYLIWSRGFKSGSYNVVSIYTPPEYVEPEEATACEIGIKTYLFDRTLQLNAAIFRTDIDNLQEQYVSLVSGGAVRVENAASARSQGVEFDVVWTPMPNFNPGFVISAGGTFLDATYTSYPNASGFDETTGLISQNLDFSGNEIPRAAKTSGNLALSQTFNASGGPLEASIDAYFSSGVYFTNQNTEAASQSDYQLINGRLSWLYEPWELRMTLFGQNLADKAYANASSTLDFGTTLTLALPRTYGVRLQWEFGR